MRGIRIGSTKRLLGSGSVVIALGVSAGADTLTVPDDFETIQQAIDAAADGDEIIVLAGVYAEQINLSGKALRLRGADPQNTIIDGGEVGGFVLTLTSGEPSGTIIEGFTITGGRGQLGSLGASGGGVLIAGGAPTFRNLIIRDNQGIDGGGLAATNSAAVIEDVVFIGNQGNIGGGLYAEGGAVRLQNVSFLNNSAAFAGGGAGFALGQPTLIDTNFEDNTAAQFGGALYANHAQLDIRGIDARRNGTAVIGANNTVTYSTFGGGGIYVTSVSGRLDRGRFVGNAAYAGGGLYIAGDSANFEVFNVLVRGSVSALGSGAYFNSSSPRISNATIIGNGSGALFTTYNSFPTVVNSVLGGNNTISPHATEIAGNGQVQLSFSAVATDSIFSTQVGDGVLIGPLGLDSKGRPLPGSPVIDAGLNAALPADVTLDLDGEPRFVDDPDTDDTGVGEAPIVDLGAFEFQVADASGPGDVNGDGAVDMLDMLLVLSHFGTSNRSADATGDGFVGMADLMLVLSHFGTTY